MEDRELWALRDVSFDLAKGESLALVGRNGAGKSTILKLLANITRPTSGNITVDGRLSALIELGSGFHPDLTGRENIYLNGTILGLSRTEIERRYDEIVAFSEIERFIETPVKRYSSGMLVRLGFAVASFIEPDILLVDEVLAVGDASFRQKCMERIQTLLDGGTSIIFVSHNLNMVQTICPMSIYLEKGVVKYQGKTSDVINMYERDLHEERAQKLEATRAEQNPAGDSVRITRISMLDKEGVCRQEFKSDQSIEIRIEYDSFGAAGPANAAVRIIRSDGTICCLRRTKDDDVRLFLKERLGAFSIVIDPIQLTSGMYQIEARITNEQSNVVLANINSEWFYVNGSGIASGYRIGVFDPNSRWLISKDERAGTPMEDEEVYVGTGLRS
jgi:lipopolysaccharide transport system ATP-binding protein